MTPEARDIAEHVVSKLEPRLQRMEDDLGTIRPYFELKPGMEPLPTRMSNAEQVIVAHQAALDDIRNERRSGWLENLKGGWTTLAALIAALAAILAAYLK